MIRTSTPKNVSGTATIDELERFLRISGDKRRELFADWGLRSNCSTAWSEIWSAMGLEATQPRKLWADLQTPLLENKEVARIIGVSVETINDWCNKENYPKLFPPPIRLGSRKKLWISLEVLAFKQPSLFLARAKEIRRHPRRPRSVKPTPRVMNINLNPLTFAPVTQESSSRFDQSANLTDAERIARDKMFQSTEELISEIARQKECFPSPEAATMSKVIELLEAEIEAGHPSSPRRRAQCALRSLLRVHKLFPHTAELNLEHFDRLFPLTGWNPAIMPTMTQATYLDYRKRARGGVKRALGISQRKSELRTRVDGWSNAVRWLINLPEFKSRRFVLSPIESTLTRLARGRGFQPGDITQKTLLTLYADALSSERKSLRNAARIIERLQDNEATVDGVRSFFPDPITAIRTSPRREHVIPSHFQIEIDMMVEISTRVKHSRIRKQWTYLSEKTRDSHRKVMRAIINALIVVDRLHPSSNTIRNALSDSESILEALSYILSRVDRAEIKASTSATLIAYLPPILERNEIYIPNLRKEINAIPEFELSIKSSQMGVKTQDLCRALIERLDMRADFLLSHAPLRREAESILRLAKNEKRGLSRSERTRVRQLGAAALFCAIECGGAPIRVENFLETTVNVPDAWLTLKSKDEFRLVVPANKVKNKKPIDAPIPASKERYHDTVRWFLDRVRPHFFRDDSSKSRHEDNMHENAAKIVALQCPWLLPGVKNPRENLGYTTFLGWFQKHMRDIVGIACDPHNFRHGQASLLYYEYPERIDLISARLGDDIDTVVIYYAWIHNEMLMRDGQKALVALIPGGRRA